MKGVLLSNLGSPSFPTPESLKPYLTQFLMDPYVIDVNFLLRYFLVNFLIVPKRSRESAHAYSRIWTDKGSPLVFYTSELCNKVAEKQFKNKIVIDFGMRYATPSLDSALTNLLQQGVNDLLVIPLYPQHAWATNVSTEVEVKKILKALAYKGSVKFFNAFYNDPSYIQACLDVYQKQLSQYPTFDHYLFSYHGIPERHLKYTEGRKNYCLSSQQCCLVPNAENKKCYKHHCTVNTELIRKGLALDKENVSMAFQSRLGKDPWLKPFTDFEYVRLAQAGVKRLAVFCPSFVADCLETLEEIGMRGREDFIAAGGEDLVLIQSLNSEEPWIDCVSKWIDQFYSNQLSPII